MILSVNSKSGILKFCFIIKSRYAFGFPFILWIILNGACQKEYSYEGGPGVDRAPYAPNQPPIAIAGADTSIHFPHNRVSLDGTESYDPDGVITSWQWHMIEGPSPVQFSDASAVITEAGELKKGKYRFELKVGDNGGLFSRDTVEVLVDSTGSMIIFDHLQWKNIPGCAFVIDNIYSFIPTTANFELFVKWVDTWGSVRDWKEVPKIGAQTIYDLFYYEIKGGSLIIHSTKIVCNYDESRNYSAGIKLY